MRLTRLSPRGRWALVAALAVVATAVLSIATVAAWSQRVLLDEDRFSARIASTLQQDEMNRYLAGELTEQVLARAPELITVRPAVEAVLGEALRTRTAVVGARAALREAHRSVRSGVAEESIAIDLGAVFTLASALMQRGAPDLADRFEAGLDTTRIDAAAVGLRTGLFERLDRLAALTWALFALTALLLAAMLAVAPRWRWGVLAVAGVLGAAGIVGLAGQRIAEVWMVAYLPTSEDARAAVTLAWRSMLHEYRGWNVGLLVLALAGAVGVLASSQLPDPRAVRARVTGTSWSRAAAGAGLLLVGVAVARWPLDTVRVITVAAGVVVAGGGATLLLRGALMAMGELRPAEYADRVRHPRAVIVGGAAVAILGVAATLGVWFSSAVSPEPSPVEPAPITVCNSHELLCDRPLDQVTFPATHNSMAAASDRGWYFPSQRYGIAQQLRDGVRALLIDTYYGIPSPQGVLTVIDATERRPEAVRRHGEEVVEAWERLSGRMAAEGEPELYLCHSYCELGATPLRAALVDIRDYLDEYPGEFVVVVVQDTTSPEDTVRAFEEADLASRAYAHTSGEPWPTLGELLAEGLQLLVLAEEQAGEADWYQPAFALIQETQFQAPTIDDLGCEPGRGDASNPLFLLNHWVSERPALPSRALEVNAYDLIVERARTCAEQRGRVPNLVVVDFYDVGDVLPAVRALNGLPAQDE